MTAQCQETVKRWVARRGGDFTEFNRRFPALYELIVDHERRTLRWHW